MEERKQFQLCHSGFHACPETQIILNLGSGVWEDLKTDATPKV